MILDMKIFFFKNIMKWIHIFFNSYILDAERSIFQNQILIDHAYLFIYKYKWFERKKYIYAYPNPMILVVVWIVYLKSRTTLISDDSIMSRSYMIDWSRKYIENLLFYYWLKIHFRSWFTSWFVFWYIEILFFRILKRSLNDHHEKHISLKKILILDSSSDFDEYRRLICS